MMIMQRLKNVLNRKDQGTKFQGVKPVFLDNTIKTGTKKVTRVRRFKRGMMIWVDVRDEK